MSRRAEQIAAELQRHIAQALVPVLPNGSLVTVTRVHVTDDIRVADVYLAGWDTLTAFEQRQAQRAMQSATKTASQAKFTPKLVFHHDDSAEYAARIARLIQDDTSGTDVDQGEPSA